MNSSSSSSDRDPLEQLAAEFLDRRRSGEPVSPSKYAEEYPQWAEQILEFFPALEVMEGLKPGPGDRTASHDDGAPLTPPPPLEQLGEYRILREIGRGGMGVVYEAIQETLGRRVALKILPMHGRIDAIQMQRFQLEARSAARLHHPSIVPVYGVGEAGGIHYYVMQYIPGHGLDVILDDLRRLRTGEVGGGKSDTDSIAVARSLLTGRFAASEPERGDGARSATVPEDNSGCDTAPGDCSATAASISSVLTNPTESGYYRAVARLGNQVAGALAHAHAQGVLHRDIKPSNLLLDVDGHVWVTDFGLAKVEGAEGLTRTDDIIGTLRFMGPERFEGWSDRRSDIYGLGVTLYEMLTLRPAFDAGTRLKLIEQVIHDPPLAPRKVDPRVPRDLETIVLKSIAKEPGERYATAEALASDLENYLADKTILARRSSPVERAWRWCRRNKAAAGLLAASGIAALALVGVVVGIIYNSRLKAANYDLRVARQAEESLQYFNHMVLAEREWSDSNVGRAEQLLDECVPNPGSKDLRGWEWHYSKRQCHTDLKTIPVFPTQAMAVAFSPDDRHLATTGYDDKAVRVWNVQTGKLEMSLVGLSPEATMSEGLAYSPDGKLIAASSGNFHPPGGVVIWDAVTGEQLWNSPEVWGYSPTLAFSPDGNRLAALCNEWDKSPTLRIWDRKLGKTTVAIPGAKGEMGWISVAFSPDGDSIATASGTLDQTSPETQSGEVKMWNSWTGKLIATLRHSGYSGPLTSVAYSPDCTQPLIATTGWDKMLRLWDVEAGQEIKSVRAAPQVTFKVVFSPDGRRLATASDDNAVRIWDATTLEEIVTLRGHTREVHGLAFSSDGRRLATLSMDGTVKIWDAVQAKHPLTLPGRQGYWVQAVTFSPDGRRIASGGIDATLRVHDAASGQPLQEFKGLTEPIEGVAYSPDGKMIATGSGNWKKAKTLGRITLWDAEDGTVIRTLEAHVGMVLSVAFSPNGSRLATAGGDYLSDLGLVKIWDTKTGEEIKSLEGHSKGRVRMAYSPDGRFLASAGWDSRVILRDANTWLPIGPPIEGHKTFIMGVAFTRDGARLATAGIDAAVIVWDTTTGREVCRFLGHKGIVWCVAFSPDGKRAASGGDDGTVKIWDPMTGQEAKEALTLRGHADPVLCVAFSPDGTRLASSSKDGTVKIWDGSPWVEPTSGTSQASRVNGTH
jgi:WD40 repeat protein/serine/threonine protein kinase